MPPHVVMLTLKQTYVPLPYTVRTMKRSLPLILFAILAVTLPATAQDRLKSMPGYDQYQRLSEEIPGSVKMGTLNVTWKDASTFEYNKDGKQYRFDIKSLKADEIGTAAPRQRGPRGAGPDRG